MGRIMTFVPAALCVFLYLALLNIKWWDFPGSPVVKTSPSNSWNVGLIPAHGAKIPHDSQPKNQNIKQKQYCNKF